MISPVEERSIVIYDADGVKADLRINVDIVTILPNNIFKESVALVEITGYETQGIHYFCGFIPCELIVHCASYTTSKFIQAIQERDKRKIKDLALIVYYANKQIFEKFFKFN